MVSYRVEYAKSNRAICQCPKCKKEKVKIAKGDLKLGTWIEVPAKDIKFWSFRKWGCVTPKQVENLNVTFNGDLEMFDGYDELSEEDQLRVRKALEAGHIDDADCSPNVDIELNRPGAVQEKAAAAKDAKEKVKDAYKHVSRELWLDYFLPELALIFKAALKKAVREKQKAKLDEEEHAESDPDEPPAKRARTKKNADTGATKTKQRGRGKAAKEKEVLDDQDDVVELQSLNEAAEALEPEQPKKGRGSRAKKGEEKPESATGASKPRKGRAAKADVEPPMEDAVAPAATKSRRGRSKKE